MDTPLVCIPKALPRSQWVQAAEVAAQINPGNQPSLAHLARAMPGFRPTPQRIAVVTAKYWGRAGVKLRVAFLDSPPADLRAKILLHMNAWGRTANVTFVASNTDPQVRIARLDSPPSMSGYWSYVGTDILGIPRNRPTLNLDSFTMQTPESEFFRVVRHEAGHTLGFPHEHMRRQLVAKIDRRKAIQYFGRTQGWTPLEVQQQVLTPIEESSIRGTAFADPRSIMCYQIPGIITRDGRPIIGGRDIDQSDFDFIAQIYPKPRQPAPPSPGRGRARRKTPRKGK